HTWRYNDGEAVDVSLADIHEAVTSRRPFVLRARARRENVIAGKNSGDRKPAVTIRASGGDTVRSGTIARRKRNRCTSGLTVCVQDYPANLTALFVKQREIDAAVVRTRTQVDRSRSSQIN